VGAPGRANAAACEASGSNFESRAWLACARDTGQIVGPIEDDHYLCRTALSRADTQKKTLAVMTRT
jgi:hypothetical protein